MIGYLGRWLLWQHAMPNTSGLRSGLLDQWNPGEVSGFDKGKYAIRLILLVLDYVYYTHVLKMISNYAPGITYHNYVVTELGCCSTCILRSPLR